ncbi:MAG: hypothetical protein AAFU68_02940 [Pseudomonadota bacterium]
MGPYAVITIDLTPPPECECGICGKWGDWRNAVGFCCEPTHDEIGSESSVYPGLIVGGRAVCKACHDDFYYGAEGESNE